jgi:hypothetical protein
MPYLGRQPGVGVRNRYIYTATASQTTFSGADDNGATLAYDDAAYVDVYLNGVLLIPVTDYAATTKTSIVLTSGAAASDLLEILAYEISSIADTVSKANGGTFDGAITVNGNFSADGGTIKLDGNHPVGTGNVALGNAALDDASLSGPYNVAIGNNALTANSSGDRNIATGGDALASNQTGSSNTVVGNAAMYSNSSGSYNVGVGGSALSSNSSGNYNVAAGYQSLYTNTTSWNTAVGAQAAYSTQTGVITAVGSQALYSNTTGTGNTAVGGYTAGTNYAALFYNTTGSYNTAVGGSALRTNSTASYNTAVGYQAGYSNQTGINSTFIGYRAGYSSVGNSGVAGHVIVGADAGYSLTSATTNTFVGKDAGYYVTTGSANTILGRYTGNQGGLDIRTSSNYIVLSDGDGNPRGVFDSSGHFLVNQAATNIAVVGVAALSTGRIRGCTDANETMELNRLNSDGTLILFYQDTVPEGSISVSGSTVSYNGGHLSRWSQTADNSRIDILKGTVMTNLDQMAEWTNEGVTENNEQLNCMAVSSVEGDPNVAGVFVNWDNDDDVYTNDMNVAMTGDMIIRIAQGTTVQRGDLLMSAGDGTAKPQGDDIVRSKTIAKVTSTHVTCTYDDGSYCVPCVLMAC